jgi:DNA polymerase III subunit epsilon
VNFLGTAVEYLLGGPKVGGADEERLRRWIALPGQEPALPHARARYVVVAAGTRGRDPLPALGAVGVDQARIDLVDCFATVPQGARGSANTGVLGHGGGQAPPAAAVPALAMLDFLEFLGKAPLVAYDAGAVRTIVERAVKSILGVPFRAAWVDLAAVLPALFPNSGRTTRAEWLDRFGLAGGAGQDTLAEAFATAQLFLAALEASTRAGVVNAAQLIAVRQARR